MESTQSSPSLNVEDSMQPSMGMSNPQNETTSSVDVNAPANEMSTMSSPSSTVESTASSPVLENMTPTNETNKVAESPATKERSPKQKEADEGAAEILKRMRNMYDTEFADIPANKRPKPAAWAARAALYKNGEEREEYIQNMMRNARNSLTTKNSANNNPTNIANGTNDTEMLMEQLMSALDTATKVAREIKNKTRKGKTSMGTMNAMNKGSAMNAMNKGSAMNAMNSRSGMNTMNKGSSMNAMNTMNTMNTMNKGSAMNNGSLMNNNSYMNNLNGINNRQNFTRSKRVSPLSRKSKSKRTSKYNEPSLEF